MRRLLLLVTVLLLASFLCGDCAYATVCVDCHAKVTPRIVDDWQMSSHRRSAVDCVVCHGDDHLTEQDISEAKIPTIDICAACHEKQVLQFKGGKHACAWASMKAMPAAHWQPMALREGEKGCAGCHRIGIKPEADIRAMKKAGIVYGRSSCDSCHSAHLFSVEEARQPRSCQICHTGADHPQWEMCSGSGHGVRFLLKQTWILPETAATPTCQTCHMRDGDHTVRAAWGFPGVRLPGQGFKAGTCCRRK
ncbi:MAG TPA: multiheme c-type cytochrome [Dissulfurispiraceae bacterium]|nr:multiheme c-type cytochrome [Dissulfurispiraceae bacterium]